MRTRPLALVLAGVASGLAALSAPAAHAADRVEREQLPTFADEPLEGVSNNAIVGEIAVDLRDDATASDLADLAATYAVSLRPNSAWSTTHDKLEVADVDPVSEDALIERLSRDPRVERAEPMAVYRESFVPNDPLYASKQWNLRRVGAERAWSYSCGKGIVVAVVDTGVACFDKGPFSRGTDLAGTRCDGGWNFVTDTREAYDDQGHGTHVAGTIAQTTDNGMGAAGLAFCATLMPIKVLNKQGFGTVANVAEGIRFAADEGAQIINLSLGGPIKSAILKDAIDHALAAGVVVVAAAGNSGKSVGWPAAYPGVVAVSATDDNDAIAWFSSRGPEVAIAAPGVGVTQQTVCNGGRDRCEMFGTFNGTSMASPHVAGTAAMIEALGVTRAGAVTDALFGGARAPAAGADPNRFGAGILMADDSVARIVWHHLVLRVFALVGLGLWLRRRIQSRGGRMTRRPGAWLGACLAGVGLMPLAPVLGLLTRASRAREVVELAMRPLGDWDALICGAGTHRWLLLASALPAVILSALGFRNRRLRPFIGGIALGTAGLLSQMVWSGDAAYVGGPFLARVWEVGNALVCVWLARVALDVKRPKTGIEGQASGEPRRAVD